MANFFGLNRDLGTLPQKCSFLEHSILVQMKETVKANPMNGNCISPRKINMLCFTLYQNVRFRRLLQTTKTLQNDTGVIKRTWLMYHTTEMVVITHAHTFQQMCRHSENPDCTWNVWHWTTDSLGHFNRPFSLTGSDETLGSIRSQTWARRSRNNVARAAGCWENHNVYVKTPSRMLGQYPRTNCCDFWNRMTRW